ncbi:hypothetical protein PybrP1_005471 [[Pythium] brassicae (nom. inval.)]|nr:hypothetical protein PybrP1_005471 [[Pythium] brassicae (nom. inval.)]
MPDAKRSLAADSRLRVAADGSCGGLRPTPTPREARRYFVSEEEEEGDEPPQPNAFEHKLSFQYKGDVFAQRGVYADATLYMSRLPPTRKAAAIRPKPGAKYTQQVRLEPMTPSGSEARGGEKTSKAGKKRQYVVAVEAMAANPALLANLLSDNVVPNVLALCRTKDAGTLASCVSTLCHLSSEAAGRQAILSHNALPILIALVAGAAHEKRILSNSLATLANLTIEDTFESAFVKEKALESIVSSRRAARVPLADELATFAIFNLSCPNYSYPRVEDVIRALVELGRDARDQETLSRALYNFSCTKMNQLKLMEATEATSLLRAYISSESPDAVRWHALASFWHLSDNSACRRAVIRADCVRALVAELPLLGDDKHVKCALLTLLNLSFEPVARELMGSAKALDALDVLSQRVAHATELQVLIYELIAVIVSDPNNICTVSESFFRFLLSFEHSAESWRAGMSCCVLFAATCILAWSDQEASGSVVVARDSASGALITDASGSARLRAAQSLEELLDEPQHLQLIYRHVEHDGFNAKSPELYLQVLLLYNLTFRYSKTDVAKLAATWMTDLAQVSSEERVLSLLCGTYFNLCQEYEVHAVLSSSGALGVLERFARLCEGDTKAMCLEVVCIIFDGRCLSQSALVALATTLFPVLAEICANGGAGIRAGCAACFARFAMIDECRKPMVDSGLVVSLAILASEDDAQTLRLCVHAYSYLSRNAAVCSRLIRSGVVKSLTYLAAAPEEAVRRACAMTLCNISTSEENVDALVKVGALRALLVISCVKSNDPETRRICMKAVMNLLRHAANVAQMCQDGLLWGFGLFVSGMEPTDFDIVADAFCALSFYPATRRGTTKSSTLTQLFDILHSPASLASKVMVLKGISNVLCEASSAPVLIGAGILPHLARVIDEERRDTDVKTLVAHILVLLFQSTPDAETEFADPATLRVVAEVMKGEREGCSALFIQAARDAQTNLVRCIYNISCDDELLLVIAPAEFLPYVAMAVHNHGYATEIAKVGAGVLRNLSCVDACHQSLMADTSIAMLRDLYDVDDSQCREDVGICACNLFLGKSNTSFLLSVSLLPLVLWLCGHPALENRALCSAVLRKLAIAPGNTEILVDGGAVGPLALLTQQCSSLYVKKNCIAVFCLLSQRPGIPSVLGSVGIVSSVLELLEDGESANDPLFETMCVHLLSALAEFARADNPREGRIASILYDLMDRDTRPTTSAQSGGRTWQNDRGFLSRDVRNGGQLPTPELSRAHWVAPNHLPMFHTTLYPALSRGYSVDFSLVASRVDTHTIEPLIPDFWALCDASTESSDDPSGRLHRQPQSATFVPPEMFTKNRSPFLPVAAAMCSQTFGAGPSSSNEGSDAADPPKTLNRKVPPRLTRHRSGHEKRV